jgi:hypothetical protein
MLQTERDQVLTTSHRLIHQPVDKPMLQQGGLYTDDVGPNVSLNANNFFQTDRDIALLQTREAKRSKQIAQPISIPSKVLDVHFGENLYAYVGESGRVSRKYNLSVCWFLPNAATHLQRQHNV